MGAVNNGNGARVLVVDDEPNITELVAMALRYEGFTVKTAATGRSALTTVSQFSPSLVILDVMLPDIDGLEVLKRLNSAGTKVPIIFLTAKDATEGKVHGLTIGGDDYVTKPFSIEELMARVRVVLRRHGKLDDVTTRAMEVVHRNIRQQVRLVDDLLDLSRILHGKFILRFETFDLREQVHAAVEEGRIDRVLLTCPVAADPAGRMRKSPWEFISRARGIGVGRRRRCGWWWECSGW